jgi:DNA-binding GntR family transcriptional regulator
MAHELKAITDGLQRLSLRQQVATLLRKDILRGIYLPGDRIVEAEIACKLNISRGPVREAIRQLEEEGLVLYSNNRGCTVTILEPEDAWEIYLLRADLECLAIKLCGGKLEAPALAEMQHCIQTMEEAARANDLAEIVEQDHHFHSIICKASKNKRLHKLWASLNNSSYALFLTVLSTHSGSLSEMAGKHQKVLDKLRLGEDGPACQSVKDHYLGTGRTLFLKHGADAPLDQDPPE